MTESVSTLNPKRQPFDILEGLSAFESPESAWRTLTSFAVYRLAVVLVLAIAFWGFERIPIIGTAAPGLAGGVLATYLLVSVGLILLTQLRAPSATVQLSLQVLMDICMLVLLMHASGGTRSGIGMLLLVSLAAAALMSQGRLALFHAAIASLAVLFLQSWQFLYHDASLAEFLPSGMLATGYFVIASLGYTLAKYARGAAQIAQQRGVDLENLAQINELVIRDMQDGFIVVDENGVIRQHNTQSESLIPSLVEATGQPLQRVAPQLAQLLEDWRRDRSQVFAIVRDTGSQRDYQVRFVAIGRAEVSPTVVFIEDASRLRMQAQQMKLVSLGRLTASIAHEIRNPLSSINHAAQLLGEETTRSTADTRLVSIIQDNAHRLDRLVEEVLYLNRRDRAHPESIVLSSFLERFTDDFCTNEKRSRDMLTLDVEPTLRAMFDRTHLDQVMWNLVRNACRFAQRGPGAVRVDCVQRGDRVQVDVEDNGPGVKTDALPHLFEPFFTTDAKGTGLGLYIARELAEVNGATLEYVVDNAGGGRPAGGQRGACFRLTMKSA
ncbi:MAG: two-component system sensor histidine kinase NtrB [Burkholderiales bacterium]